MVWPAYSVISISPVSKLCRMASRVYLLLLIRLPRRMASRALVLFVVLDSIHYSAGWPHGALLVFILDLFFTTPPDGLTERYLLILLMLSMLCRMASQSTTSLDIATPPDGLTERLFVFFLLSSLLRRMASRSATC